MTISPMVEVTIFDAPTVAAAGSCGCGCDHHGHDHAGDEDPMAKVSLAFQARALAMTLERDFPGQTRVEYINVLQDPRGPRLPQTNLLCAGAYPTPLVYINGQGRFAGSLPEERIREEVAKILESSHL